MKVVGEEWDGNSIVIAEIEAEVKGNDDIHDIHYDIHYDNDDNDDVRLIVLDNM